MTTEDPNGELDLERLLAGMEPALDPVLYAFCRRPDAHLPEGAIALGMFREREAVTLILEAPLAERLGFATDFIARRVVLTVHSDLAAVGLLARVSAALAAAGIAANVVSAVFHDHLFVAEGDGERALAVLQRLQSTARQGDHPALYSVTVRVDAQIAGEWLEWMRAVHVPDVLRTGAFLDCAIGREVDPPGPGGRVTFVLDYRAASIEALRNYQAGPAPALQRAHAERYAGRFEASRSIRTLVPVAAPGPRLD